MARIWRAGHALLDERGMTKKMKMIFVAVFVTTGGAGSNVTNAAAGNAAGSPEKVLAGLLPPRHKSDAWG
jgi:hypothetical protein